MYNQFLLTWWMSISFKEIIQNFKCLRCEWGSSLAFFGRFAADEIGEILDPVLVSLFCLLHPAFQHWLNLLSTLRSDVQLLKPEIEEIVCEDQGETSVIDNKAKFFYFKNQENFIFLCQNFQNMNFNFKLFPFSKCQLISTQHLTWSRSKLTYL